MNFERLFYMNILYECNNDCIFCISHNTKNRTVKVKGVLDSIKKADLQLNFSERDIFIVNGGETTISREFFEIINFLKSKRTHIVVYTNGRRLGEPEFRDLEKLSNIRWIVPFYGLSEIHDYFTNVRGSFFETYFAMKNFPENARKLVGIKLLIKEDQQLKDFENIIEDLKNEFQEFHFSFILDNNSAERFKIAKKVSPLIESLYEMNYRIKISNLPLCCLSGKLKSLISNHKESDDQVIGEYFFIENDTIKQISYDRNHRWCTKCKNCTINSICPDNFLRYRALTIENGKVFLGEE